VRRLGVEGAELRPGEDAATVAREAAERGATALGMAGGDGSLGAVAAVALEQAVDRRRLLGLLVRAVRSRLDAAEGWVEWAVPAFRIVHARQRVRAALDGDPVVLESPLEFEIRPRALRVLVPLQ